MTILDPSETFASLSETIGLDTRLRKAVARLGHTRPTLVQSKCLPLAISAGRDLLVRAKTGSGKTLAYCLPVLQKLINRKKRDGVAAVILVPTRELCNQVHTTLKQLTYYCDDQVSLAVLSIGRGRGEKEKQELERQEAMLRDLPDLIVATPAGLLAHIRSGSVDLKTSVETIVVDEADLVLSFGYSDDIAEIVKALPRICQGFLMSATLSPELDSLKKIVLHSPVILKLEDDEKDTTGNLKQFYVALPAKDKNLVLYVFLKLGLLKGKGLFFVNSTDAGYRLKLFLEQLHVRSSVLNAELPFRSRLNIIEQFNLGNFDYLIATDASADAGLVTKAGENDDNDSEDEEIDANKPKRKQDNEYGVSRGLDFKNVSFVVNVDFPPNPRSYAHRVGRTARGGARGVALSLVELESQEQLEMLGVVQDEQPRLPFEKANTDKLQAVPMDSEDAPEDVYQPMPLDFNLSEIEGFRYRVEDVTRKVTRNAVRDTRAAELKAEILNSERLQSHFDENPKDLQLLAHDRISTLSTNLQPHLKHVPKYLLPRGMQVATLNKKRKKKVRKGTGGQRRTDNDPLHNFDGEVNLDGLDDEGGNDEFAEFMEDDGEDSSKKRKIDVDSKVFTNTKDGTGRSTAGRNAWKAKHRKGKFSNKKRMSERRRKDPLGI